MRSRPLRFAGLACAVLVVGLFGVPALAADRVGSGFSKLDSTAVRRAAVPDTGQHRVLRWSPAPRERCDWFVVFEAGVAYVHVDAMDWVDQTLFTNSVGLMRNVGGRDAVGGSLDAHWLNGEVVMAPTVRWRRFTGRSASVEAMLGWGRSPREGLDGPIGQVRYAPVPQVYVQAGALPYQRYVWVPYPQEGFAFPRQQHDTRAFVGIGFTGAPAAAAWSIEALALAVTFVVVMGLSN